MHDFPKQWFVKKRNRLTTICHKCHVVCLVCKLRLCSLCCLEIVWKSFKWILWAHAKNSQHLHKKGFHVSAGEFSNDFFLSVLRCCKPSRRSVQEAGPSRCWRHQDWERRYPQNCNEEGHYLYWWWLSVTDDDDGWIHLSLSALLLLPLTFTCPKTPPPHTNTLKHFISTQYTARNLLLSSRDLLWPPRQQMCSCSWYHPSFHRLSFKNKKKKKKTIYQFCGNQWLGGGEINKPKTQQKLYKNAYTHTRTQAGTHTLKKKKQSKI